MKLAWYDAFYTSRFSRKKARDMGSESLSCIHLQSFPSLVFTETPQKDELVKADWFAPPEGSLVGYAGF